jgi:hypothetical protein
MKASRKPPTDDLLVSGATAIDFGDSEQLSLIAALSTVLYVLASRICKVVGIQVQSGDSNALGGIRITADAT